MSGVFLGIVNMSVAAGWIVLAVVLLRLLLKKAPKGINVLLWGIVALRLMCPFSVESVLSLIPSAEIIDLDVMTDPLPQIDSGVPLINETLNPIMEEVPLQLLVPFLAWGWVVGLTAMLLYTVFSYGQVKRKVGTAVLVRDNIYQSEAVVSPFVLGLFKPNIYLSFAMSEQNIEHVIAHERAHIARKDHWWKPLGFLLLSIHWFNPLMWLAYVLLCRDIELACDEKVVKTWDRDQKADYTQALLACSVNRRVIAACPVAFGEVGVKKRVKAVLRYRKPAVWITAVAMVACIMASLCFLTDPPQAKKPEPEPPQVVMTTTTIQTTRATSVTKTTVGTVGTTRATSVTKTTVGTVGTTDTTTESAATALTTTSTSAEMTPSMVTEVITSTEPPPTEQTTQPTVLPTGCVHQWGEWKTVREADCLVEGMRVRDCTLCGKTQERTLPCVDHQESGWDIFVAPTALQNGSKSTVCIYCGKFMQTIPLSLYEDAYTKQAVSHCSYAIADRYMGESTYVKISSTMFGVPVRALGEESFINANVQHVVIPDSVERIGKRAFKNCTALHTVEIGNKVEAIDSEAFQGCDSLRTVRLPASLKRLGSACFGDGIKAVYFEGDAPSEWGDKPFADGTVIYYNKNASGWASTPLRIQYTVKIEE